MNEKKYCIMDIGGTKIFAFLVDEERNVLFRKKFDTKKTDDPKILLAQLDEALKETSEQLRPGEKPEAVGLCIAAFINHREGTIHSAPNLPIKTFLPLQKILSERWSIPVIMENDANAAVLGEVCYGAARGCSDAMYVTISTGVGGGLFLNNRLYRGREGFAGEIGHIKFGAIRNLCGCGKKGCLESTASGSAIQAAGRNTFNNQNLETADIFALYEKKDKKAEKIIEEAINSIGLTFANIISLLNLECIVVGGGVTKAGDFFIPAIAKVMEENISIPGIKKVELVKAALEPESGVWGVYSLLTAGPGGESLGY